MKQHVPRLKFMEILHVKFLSTSFAHPYIKKTILKELFICFLVTTKAA